jgi:Bacterial regulatory protein, arsR family
VNELVEALELAQPQVSKHLRVLREVGASTSARTGVSGSTGSTAWRSSPSTTGSRALPGPNTEVFAPFPDDGALNAMTLVERAGRTTLTTLVQHSSVQARDMHINSGMEGGMQEAFDKLEQVAISLRG